MSVELPDVLWMAIIPGESPIYTFKDKHHAAQWMRDNCVYARMWRVELGVKTQYWLSLGAPPRLVEKT